MKVISIILLLIFLSSLYPVLAASSLSDPLLASKSQLSAAKQLPMIKSSRPAKPQPSSIVSSAVQKIVSPSEKPLKGTIQISKFSEQTHALDSIKTGELRSSISKAQYQAENMRRDWYKKQYNPKTRAIKSISSKPKLFTATKSVKSGSLAVRVTTTLVQPSSQSPPSDLPPEPSFPSIG